MARFGAASSLNRGPRFQPRLGGVQLWRNVARWPGTHFCALYSGPVERDRLLYPFLEEGLRQGDKCLCLIDDVEPAVVRNRAVGPPGPAYSRRSAQLDVERASDAYSLGGVQRRRHEEPSAGEMSWVLPGPPGWDDLFRYESALNQVVEHMPAILICL